jgi:hypothetical protein
MKVRNTPVVVPFKLKWRDFSWHIAFGLLVVIVFFLSTGKAAAQVQSFNKVDFVTYQKDSLYSISVPDYMVAVNDLNDAASLQFKNIFNETYLIVVAEDKSQTGHAVLEQLEAQFKSNLLQMGGRFTHETRSKIDRCDSFQKEAEWVVDGEPLVYLVTFIDTPEVLFKIYCWTLASNKENLVHFRKAVDSFQLGKYHSKT